MIPAVAGVVAGLIAVQQPQAFRTTATLQLPHDVTSSPAEVAQLVADFKAAANNPTVQSKVSKNTGLTLQQIRHMNITQVGDSSQLTLGYQTKAKSPTAAKAVILGISSGALDYLEAPESSATQQGVDAANGKIKTAQDTIDKANTDLLAIYKQVQSSTPEDDLKRSDSARASSSSRCGAAEGTRRRGVQDAIKLRTSDPRLQKVVPRSRPPGQVADAQKVISDATTERDTAVAKLAVVSAITDLTFSAEGTPVVRKTRVVKTAAAAVVAGFPIAVGVVLLLDALQKRRKNRSPRPTRDELDELDDDLQASAGADVPLPATASSLDARGPAASTVDDEVPSTRPVHEGAPIPAMAAARAGWRGDLADDEDDADDLEDVDPLDIEADLEAEEEAEADEDAEVTSRPWPPTRRGRRGRGPRSRRGRGRSGAVADAEDADEDEAELEPVAQVVDEDRLETADDGELTELSELDDEDLDLDEVDELEDLDELEDEDLDDEDLDDELDEDVAATVASRRRMYDADIDDDLSVDGGQAATNGHGRVWARVPAADEDFDGDDEAGADR